jgi:hypothetical protein
MKPERVVMDQVAGRVLVFDRKVVRVACDLDRAPTYPIAGDLDGLMRALALALPVSALLWIGAVALLMSVIR